MLKTAQNAGYLLSFILMLASPALAQSAPTPGIIPLPSQQHTLIPFANTDLPPELVQLIQLEIRFSEDVAKGGGKAFASWFAEDAVTLSNGQPMVRGHRAIADHAQWDPKTYQLTWVPQGAQMSSAGDMGFTWGHYEADSKDNTGKPIVLSGRYITIWKKVADGSWKVALDASANDVPDTSAP